jgi:hypothetical protein
MAKNENQKMIMDILGTKPIAFNPDLAHALGSVKAGLLLSQLLFWCGKGRNPDWVYKTIEEIKKETALSRSEQDNAIIICKKYNLIEVKRKGIPAKRHFKINNEKIIKLLESYYSSLSETDKQVCKKKLIKIEIKSQSNTENTHIDYNKEILSTKEGSLSSKKLKPYYRDMPIVLSKGKRWCIPPDNSPWLEFDEKYGAKDIKLK